MLDMVGERKFLSDWYQRCKSRPSFAVAITHWENRHYLSLMKGRGAEYWPKVQQIIQTMH